MFRSGSVLIVPLVLALASPAASGFEETAVRTSYEVEVLKDISYYEGPDADPVKHKLDLYLPKGKQAFPVLLFVHGGAWMSGDKNYFFDVYGKVGKNFARQGIGTVVTNYRLTPKVQHPGHIQDVARAFAWTKRNISRHGGDPSQLFVCGHSAGGHLAALLATDPRYLEAVQCSLKDIRGAIPLSGVYNLPPGKLFDNVFTADAETRKQAMPLTHVKGGHPPFLILYAESDFPLCDRMSEEFCTALKKCSCEARVERIKERDHLSIIAHVGNAGDPAVDLMVKFIHGKSSAK